MNFIKKYFATIVIAGASFVGAAVGAAVTNKRQQNKDADA
jgi:hypothetical protein